jgi:hypothetical protein
MRMNYHQVANGGAGGLGNSSNGGGGLAGGKARVTGEKGRANSEKQTSSTTNTAGVNNPVAAMGK